MSGRTTPIAARKTALLSNCVEDLPKTPRSWRRTSQKYLLFKLRIGSAYIAALFTPHCANARKAILLVWFVEGKTIRGTLICTADNPALSLSNHSDRTARPIHFGPIRFTSGRPFAGTRISDRQTRACYPAVRRPSCQSYRRIPRPVMSFLYLSSLLRLA